MARALRFSDAQIKIGAGLGITHVIGALVAHWWVNPTCLKATALSGALMAGTRTLATMRGLRRGPLSLMVILSDLRLSIGGFALAHQFEADSARAAQ